MARLAELGEPDAFDIAAERTRRGVKTNRRGIEDEYVGPAAMNTLTTLGELLDRAKEESTSAALGGDFDPQPVMELVANVTTPGAQFALQRAGGALGSAGGKPIRAYHGSPHDFDRFDMSKIGTGEGAQAYGHGLYFAEQEATAKAYRQQLANPNVFLEGKNIGHVSDLAIPPMVVGHIGSGVSSPGVRVSSRNPELASLSVLERDAITSAGSSNSLDEAIASLREQAGMSWRGKTAQELWNKRADALEGLRGRLEFGPGGRMYEVNINADPKQFLDWDKPLAGQNDIVRTVIERGGLAPQSVDLGSFAGQPITSAPRWAGSLREAELLRDAGIPGIKYLDQGSRAGGQGTSNYVLFRDDIIDILRKYGLAGAAPAGAAAGMAQDNR